MTNIPNLLTHLLFFYVLLGEPITGEWLYRNFIVNLYTQARARTGYYYQKLSIYWALIVVVILIGMTLQPFAPIRWINFLDDRGWGLLWVVVITACISLIPLVYWGKSGAPILSVTNLTPSILPATRNEQLLYAAVAISAGVGEELIYRGFLWFYLRLVFPLIPGWSLVIISTIIYAAGHYYQVKSGYQKKWVKGLSWIGILGNTLMGLVYGFMVYFGGSLIPSMVLHTFYELYFILTKQTLGEPMIKRGHQPTRMSRQS